jgi:hypothetical protein
MKARFYGYEYVVGMIPILSPCIFYFIFYCAGEVRSELLSFRLFYCIFLFNTSCIDDNDFKLAFSNIIEIKA